MAEEAELDTPIVLNNNKTKKQTADVQLGSLELSLVLLVLQKLHGPRQNANQNYCSVDLSTFAQTKRSSENLYIMKTFKRLLLQYVGYFYGCKDDFIYVCLCLIGQGAFFTEGEVLPSGILQF